MAIAQNLLKNGKIVGSADQVNLSNSGGHQCGQGVIDHWLVINGLQLLTRNATQGKQASSRATSEHHAPHRQTLSAPSAITFTSLAQL
jgi:hypothetical protein